MSKLQESYRSALEVHNLQESLWASDQNKTIVKPRLTAQEIDFIAKDISSIFFDKSKEEEHKRALSAFIYFYLSEYFGGN